MVEGGFLRDLTVVFAASFPILFLCRKLRLPPVLGFIVTGVFIGPNALAFLKDGTHVAALAELNLPAEHVTVPLLLRDGVPQAPAPAEEPIAAGDVLLLVGAHEDLARVIPRLEARRGEAPGEPGPTPGPAPRG